MPFDIHLLMEHSGHYHAVIFDNIKDEMPANCQKTGSQDCKHFVAFPSRETVITCPTIRRSEQPIPEVATRPIAPNYTGTGSPGHLPRARRARSYGLKTLLIGIPAFARRIASAFSDSRSSGVYRTVRSSSIA